jgi:3-oxoacyl-[acyl-carrier protein] reductase
MGVFDAFRLEGKTAVVTGAGSGIGRATAETLAAAGARVVAADIAGLDEVVAAIEADGGLAVAHPTDVSSKPQVDALVARAQAEFGSLDVMCNVAGIPSDGRIEDATEGDFDKVFAVNVKGVLFGCQAAVRAMTGGGSIINVASTAIDVPAKNYGLYAMSKAAVAMLTRTLALEVGARGIRVNTIAPGTTVTSFTMRHVYDADGTLNQAKYEAFLDHMRRASVLGTLGEAQDQAHLILYLASDAAKFCTGQVWRANGGQALPW